MKIFQCGNCNHPLFFENIRCENCGHQAGYQDRGRKMLTFDPSGLSFISDVEHIGYKFCKNKEYDVCNWLLEKDDPHEYCTACQLNRTVPNLSDEENFEKWRNLEVAKHRLIYQLQKLGLNVPRKMNNENGLCFDFIESRNDPNIMTGHTDGVVTILLKEADPSTREKIREEMGEPYRTLIGHLRHEVGHYFWERLVAVDDELLNEFRALFGDEQENYSDALQKHYQNGAPENWQDSYISQYATSHPWEDWAETWAHYLHIMDMVETAHFFKLKADPLHSTPAMKIESAPDPYEVDNFSEVIEFCIPLSFAVNSLNRSMGLPDVYPFVINSAVIQKMTFIHEILLSRQ